MARPGPKILLEQEDLTALDTWQVLEGEETYLITYKSQPVSIRVVTPTLGAERKKYKRMSYTELATCQAQVRRYNKKFNTTDFDYIRVFNLLNLNQK